MQQPPVPGASRSRRGAITPLGQPMGRVPGLSFKTGQRVKLKYFVNDPFPAGTIVEIHGLEPAPQSPTQRENQSTHWTRTDRDTVYRFLKRELVTRLEDFQSPPWGDLIIPHMSLSLSPGGQPVDRAIHLGTKVYTIKPIRTTKGITTRTSIIYDVPVGIQGTVMQYATRKGGEAYGRARTSQIQNCYAVAFRLKTVRWMEVICSSKKEFNYFEALSPAEDAQYNARLRHALPPDTVVGNE